MDPIGQSFFTAEIAGFCAARFVSFPAFPPATSWGGRRFVNFKFVTRIVPNPGSVGFAAKYWPTFFTENGELYGCCVRDRVQVSTTSWVKPHPRSGHLSHVIKHAVTAVSKRMDLQQVVITYSPDCIAKSTKARRCCVVVMDLRIRYERTRCALF